jgi:hypothetical protein
VRVMSLVWSWSLPATEKLVALKLADMANDHGRNSYPAVATIAADCGLTRRGTQKVLARLVQKGCIEVEAGHTNRKSTTYRVLLNAQLGGEHGSPLEVNDVRPNQELEANDVRPRGEPRSPLEVNDVRPIRPISVLEPKNVRTLDGRRAHPLDEPPVLAPRLVQLFDELRAVYPRKDGSRLDTERQWQQLNLSVEQAEFVVAHVRMRVRAGWGREVKFVPMLWRFLAGRRWEERAHVATSAPMAADGVITMKTHACGEVLEGRVVNGQPVYPSCPRCASADAGVDQGRVREQLA